MFIASEAGRKVGRSGDWSSVRLGDPDRRGNSAVGVAMDDELRAPDESCRAIDLD
jgi:hypothetical protein